MEVDELIEQSEYWKTERWLSLEDFEGEEWRDVIGYEGLYQISDYGRVKSLDRMVASRYSERISKGLILKLSENKRGYLRIELSKNGRGRAFFTHRLVAYSFLTDSKNEVIDHKNERKSDNRLKNLRWVSQRQNVSFSKARGLIGVTRVERLNRWRADICIKGVGYYIGLFKDKETALSSYEDILLNGIENIKKYRKGFGGIFKLKNEKYSFRVVIKEKIYSATLESRIEAEECMRYCSENGIETINKYKKDKFKYTF